jgi:hypothetical protein
MQQSNIIYLVDNGWLYQNKWIGGLLVDTFYICSEFVDDLGVEGESEV